jgi:hypothetical protein
MPYIAEPIALRPYWLECQECDYEDWFETERAALRAAEKHQHPVRIINELEMRLA